MLPRRTHVFPLVSVSLLAFLPAVTGRAAPGPVGVSLSVRTHTGGETTGEIPKNMVMIGRGTFRMGLTKKELQKLFSPDTAQMYDKLTAMYPDHDETVGDLLVDIYEVTNQQFQTYLDAKNLPPSQDLVELNWSYWNAGKKVEGLPPGKEQHPVRGISWYEAARCARWLGKRLPTEVEWEYVARRGLKKDQYYPWDGKGWDAWDRSKCANTYNSRQGQDGISPWVVGHWKEDVSKDGVFDLCGNVGEWTSSEFLPYTGYEPLEEKIRGRGRKTFRFEYASDDKVVRGGSCHGTALQNNLLVRWGTSPRNAMEAVGFRTVMSALPGMDQLNDAMKRELTLLSGDFRDKLDMSNEAIAAQIVHYQDPRDNVIRGTSYLAFTKVDKLPTKWGNLVKRSVEEPVPLGILTTSSRIVDPDLPAGSYAFYFKGKGESKEQKEARKNAGKSGGEDKKEEKPKVLSDAEKRELAEQAEVQRELEKIGAVRTPRIDPLDVPTDQDILIIKNEAGDDVAWVPANVEEVRPHATHMSYIAGGGANEVNGTAAAGSALGADPGPNDLATIQFSVRAGSASRHPQLNLNLQFPPGAFEPIDPPAEDDGKKKR